MVFYYMDTKKNSRFNLITLLKKAIDEFMHFNFFLPIDLVKWLIYDVVSRTKNDNKELYGFYMYCGLPGEGKTLSLARQLSYLRSKYGDKIYICTNFRWKHEDFQFQSWKMLVKPGGYDKPLVVGFDEIQNEFQSRDFKSFPKELITAITQFRKGNGIAVYGTTQVFTNVDTLIRGQCKEVIHCRTRLNRLTINRGYERFYLLIS